MPTATYFLWRVDAAARSTVNGFVGESVVAAQRRTRRVSRTARRARSGRRIAPLISAAAPRPGHAVLKDQSMTASHGRMDAFFACDAVRIDLYALSRIPALRFYGLKSVVAGAPRR